MKELDVRRLACPGPVIELRKLLDAQVSRIRMKLTLAASRSIELARTELARLLGADPERTLLGPGATFWLNTVLLGLLGPGDRVVCSALEHNSVMRPLRYLEACQGLRVRVVHAAQGACCVVPGPDEFMAAVAEEPTRLVVSTQASNVTGAVLPVAEMADLGELAAWLDREHGILLRTGLHCAPAAHRCLRTFPDGTLRPGAAPRRSPGGGLLRGWPKGQGAARGWGDGGMGG